MARTHGKISTASWNDPAMRVLPEDARWLFRYLCTAPHSNAAGCYIAPLPYIASDLQWGIERVREGFRNLFLKPFVVYDEAAAMVYIPGWWDQNTIENDNVAKHIQRVIRDLPDCELKTNAINNMLRFPEHDAKIKSTLSKLFGNPSETVPKPIRIPEPLPEQDKSSLRDGAAAPLGGEDLKSQVFGPVLAWLVKATKKPETACRAILGKLCAQHGESRTIEAVTAAARNAPLDPVPYIQKVIRNGKSKPSARDNATEHAHALAAALGLGGMATGDAAAAELDHGPTGGGYPAAGNATDTGPTDAIRPRDDAADRVRGGVRDSVPGCGDGAENLSRETRRPAGRSGGAGDGADHGRVEVGPANAVPSGNPANGGGGLGTEANAPESRPIGTEKTYRGGQEQRDFSPTVGRITRPNTDDSADLEIPAFLDQRHKLSA